jgi:hypothetical protein
VLSDVPSVIQHCGEQEKCFFIDVSNSVGVLDVMHVMVQCGRPLAVGQRVLKIQ